MGSPTDRLHAVAPGDTRNFAGAKVTVYPAEHDRLPAGDVPYPGKLTAVPDRPTRPSHWVCGQPLSFLVELGRERIWIDSGGTTNVLPPQLAQPVDLAILGVALPVSRERFVPAIRRLRPRFILPSHQDDFFRPLADGFWFGRLTDFDAVRRAHEREQPGGLLVLLNFFQPWTLQ
jgi:hypothetical protein